MADTWQRGATGFALSNNDLTASTTVFNAVDTIIGNVGHNTGLFYAELTCGVSTSNQARFGFSTSNSGGTAIGNNNSSVAFDTSNQHFYWNNTVIANTGLARPANGNILGLAVDLGAGHIWIRNVSASSGWYGSGAGDPATGVNPAVFTAFSAPTYLAFSDIQNGNSDYTTMSGAAGGGELTFTGAAPAGFGAWGTITPGGNARASQVVALSSVQLAGNVRSSQVVLQSAIQIPANARASQTVLESAIQLKGNVRASQLVVMALMVQSTSPSTICQAIPVFPALPVGFPLKWRPTFKTTIPKTVSSGREVRYNNQVLGLHEFELNFEVLRDQTQNQSIYSPLTGYQDYMKLCQHWLQMYGRLGLFYFDAPFDDSRTDQQIGTGDGSTTEFTFYRTFGVAGAYLAEPVGGVNIVSNVKINGTIQNPATYTITQNLISFNSPPANNATITSTFSFYYLCRFMADNQDFEEFLKNIWTVKSLKFRSTYWVP